MRALAILSCAAVWAVTAADALGDERDERQPQISETAQRPKPIAWSPIPPRRPRPLDEAFDLGMLVECPDGVTLFYACPVTPVVRHGIRPAEGALIEAITELED